LVLEGHFMLRHEEISIDITPGQIFLEKSLEWGRQLLQKS
jgi:hypothetical protein